MKAVLCRYPFFPGLSLRLCALINSRAEATLTLPGNTRSLDQAA